MQRVILAVLGLVAAAGAARAQDANPEKKAAELVTPAVDRAIETGLRFLAPRQHEDGSFGAGGYRGNAAIGALAGIAFLAGGNTPERGPYAQQTAAALDYILANTQESGFIVQSGTAGYGPMYGHGFATLFLAECYGMSGRPDVREKLDKAVELIVSTQNDAGGWRYEPQRMPADISVTVCQVMALRAAHNAGIHVPKEVVDRSIEYVKRSQNADGGFMYMLDGGESAFPRSAGGVVALYSAGVYDSPEIGKGLEYLEKFSPRPGMAKYPGYYFYGHYYAVQAMWHAGGERWARWYPAIRDELLKSQRPDGSWLDGVDVDYATASALIILQMPNNSLPIFQR